MIRAWSTLGEQLGNTLHARGWAQDSRVLVNEFRGSLEQVHASYKSMQPQAPATATLSDKPEQRAAVLARPLTHEERLAALEKRMRDAGAPETGIRARITAEWFNSPGPAAAASEQHQADGSPRRATRGTDPSRQERRGPEKGTRR